MRIALSVINRRIIRWSLIVALAGGLTASVAMLCLREPSLLERDHKAFKFNRHGVEDCYWFSDHEFMVELRSSNRKLTTSCYDTYARVEEQPSKEMAERARLGLYRAGMELTMREDTLAKQHSAQSGATYVPLGKAEIQLPHNSRAIEYNRGQNDARIAWMLNVQRVPPWMAALHYLVPSFKIPVWTTRLEMWVSSADGSQMHQLGWIGSEVPSRYDHDVQWLPGNKRLSFIYQDYLYSVPVDE